MKIDVIGAGAFGTALAVALSRTNDVTLIARDAAHAADMIAAKENKRRLPDVPLPSGLKIETKGRPEAEAVLLATPMQSLAQVLPRIDTGNAALVACCKGVDLDSHQGPIDVIQTHKPDAVAALLTGPSFAHDIGVGLPTALTLACQNTEVGTKLQTALTQDRLRIYITDDTTGAQLGGALKNVMAIACGTAIGAGLGESARAALLTRGYAEMTRFAAHHGARAETLAGLSGFGDLVLTCTSQQSRNYRFGLALGLDQPFDKNTTVEGAPTARAVASIAAHEGIDMPITQTVVQLIDKNITVTDALTTLLSRPLRKE